MGPTMRDHWSSHRLAEELGTIRSTVTRVWRTALRFPNSLPSQTVSMANCKSAGKRPRRRRLVKQTFIRTDKMLIKIGYDIALKFPIHGQLSPVQLLIELKLDECQADKV